MKDKFCNTFFGGPWEICEQRTMNVKSLGTFYYFLNFFLTLIYLPLPSFSMVPGVNKNVNNSGNIVQGKRKTFKKLIREKFQDFCLLC